MNNQQLIDQGLAYHRAGDRAAAEAVYRRVLAEEPTNVSALHLLGVLAHEVGRNDVAYDLIRRALALNPKAPTLHRVFGRVVESLGQIERAIVCYQEAASMLPNDANLQNDLGNALRLAKKYEGSVAALRKAIQLDPKLADSYNNLAVVMLEIGKPGETVAAARKAIACNPGLAEAYFNLGRGLGETGETREAVVAYERALELSPAFFQAENNIGLLQFELEQYDQAIATFNRALINTPDNPDLHYNLGSVLQKAGKLSAAVESFRNAIGLRQDHAPSHNNLGNALHEFGKLDEAEAPLRAALALSPNFAEAHNNLGNLFLEKGDVDTAILCFRRAIEIYPRFPDACNNLGSALNAAGQIEEALAWFGKARALKPADANVHSNMIYTMHYHPAHDAAAIGRELAAWNREHAVPLRHLIKAHRNVPDAARRLRIGYVSADFRQHVVGCNLLPLLRERNRAQFDIYCYSHVHRPDGMTENLRAQATVWREVLGMGDDAVAELIRDDQIDILVDLALHSAHQRLLVFARKPAPVQMTYLGYCGSTGVETIDYRISDPHIDPPEMDWAYSEKTLRLPHTYWCYQAAGETPNVNALPAMKNNCITFGCLNNFAKVSDGSIELWGQILREVPGSRFVLHAQLGSHRQRVIDRLGSMGISSDRLEFVGKLPFSQFVRNYHNIDIALDPFPYGGGITSCDALWMGVPVVTLVGKTAVGRGGKSILHNVGLSRLVAQTPEEYSRIARNLAGDLEALARLRADLRADMRASKLTDAVAFAGDVEALYRTAWKAWCQNQETVRS
ncbi:MAG: tetratricopeptide repeat protein [Planctomycetota bacterium]|nr:tetratricopeptide repeat protein [Planctomycetota bacterium]